MDWNNELQNLSTAKCGLILAMSEIEEYSAHPDRVSEADFARYLDDILESVGVWILKTRNTELLLNSRIAFEFKKGKRIMDYAKLYESVCEHLKHSGEVFYYTLKRENNKIWALVFTINEDNEIVGKFAYNDSLLQCDYDFDWLMPLNKNGDVIDTEIFDINSKYDIKWLYNNWKEYESEYLK